MKTMTVDVFIEFAKVYEDMKPRAKMSLDAMVAGEFCEACEDGVDDVDYNLSPINEDVAELCQRWRDWNEHKAEVA
jgi:hypothetical protein